MLRAYKCDATRLLLEARVSRSKPNTVIEVVLDVSPSMNPFIPIIKDQLIRYVQTLPDGVALFLVCFGGDARLYFKIDALDKYSRIAAIETIRNLTTISATNIEAGLLEANKISATISGDKRRLLLTDGEANTGCMDPKQLAALCATVPTDAFMFTKNSSIELASMIKRVAMSIADQGQSELETVFLFDTPAVTPSHAIAALPP